MLNLKMSDLRVGLQSRFMGTRERLFEELGFQTRSKDW